MLHFENEGKNFNAVDPIKYEKPSGCRPIVWYIWYIIKELQSRNLADRMDKTETKLSGFLLCRSSNAMSRQLVMWNITVHATFCNIPLRLHVIAV